MQTRLRPRGAWRLAWRAFKHAALALPLAGLFGGCTKEPAAQDPCVTRALEGCLCYDDGSCEPGLVCNTANWGCEQPAAAGGAGSGGSSSASGGAPGSGGSFVNPSGGTGFGGGPAAGGSSGTGPGGSSNGSGGSGGTGQALTDIYVSPSGLDNNPGTMDQPVKTILRGVELAGPQSTVWVMPGTHSYSIRILASRNGTAENPVRIYAVPGARPVFDFSSQPRGSESRGIELRGNYWHIRGVTIYNAGDSGILISGSNNVIEDVIAHANDDTGIQITADGSQATNDAYAANNLILNCDSYDNFDEATDGENADGFAAKERIGPGNVFRGCRAWNNADDGWDFYAARNVVRVENSWAFLNGYVDGDNSNGDGNGFKLGGDPDGDVGGGHAAHVVTGSASFDNRSCGYTRNNNTTSPSVSSSKANGNETACCGGQSCGGVSGMSTSGEAAIGIARNADRSLPAIN